MRVSLIPSVQHIKPEEISGKSVVIIDVLRATSVITTAISNGATEVVPVLEISDALSYQGQGYLLGGERKALKIEGFDLSNSPTDYTFDSVAGKKLVLTTTNGTRAIHSSLGAAKIFIGCMRNGKASAVKAAESNNDVVLVCAGTNGRFSLDDFACSGKIISDLKSICSIAQLDDFAAGAYMAYRDHREDILAYVSMASHYNYLLSIGLEKDIAYCFTPDTTDVVPIYSNGVIK